MQKILRLAAFALTIALFAVNSTTFAQSGGPASLPVPPKPPEVDALGDADAVCFMAAAELGSRTQSASSNLPADQRESVFETGARLIAYYIGKLSFRFDEREHAGLIKETAARYSDPAMNKDARPIMQWCFRSYLAATNSMTDRFDEAYRLAEKPPATAPAEIDPATLDPDALCLVLIGVALPGTLDAARTNPAAAKGASLLGRSQHYFFGRVLAGPDQTLISQKLSDAWRYAGKLGMANDNATALAKTTACTNQFSAISQPMFDAAVSGLPQ